MNPPNPNKKAIGRETPKSLGFVINNFVDHIGVVYEHFLKKVMIFVGRTKIKKKSEKNRLDKP